MRWFKVTNTAHMAGSAGGSTVIARFPFAGRAIPGPFFAFSSKDLTMFGVFINFQIGMIRTNMAATASFRFARF